MDTETFEGCKKRPGTTEALEGFEYEIDLIILFMIRAVLNKVKFTVASNVTKFGNFDDLIACCEFEDGKKRTFCLQAKHKKVVKSNDCIDFQKVTIEKQFDLSKYYNNDVKNRLIFTDKDKDNFIYFIFYTTLPVDLSDAKLNWCDAFDKDILHTLFNTNNAKPNCINQLGKDENQELQELTKIDTKFLEHLFFVSDQSCHSNFQSEHKKELRNLLGAHTEDFFETIYIKLRSEIYNFYTGRTITINTDNEPACQKLCVELYRNQIFLDVVWNLACKELAGILLSHEELESLSTYFNCTQPKCLDFSNGSLLVIDTQKESTLLAMLKIYNEVSDGHNNATTSSNNNMFVKFEHLEEVINLFQYIKDLIIVDCNNIDLANKANKDIIEKIQQILNKNGQKKAVFISSNVDQDLLPYTKEYVFNMSNVTSDTQKYILNGSITFQGNDMQLRDLIDQEDITSVIDSSLVEKILKGAPVIIGQELQGLDDESEHCYIPRSFYNKHVVSREIFDTKNTTNTEDIFLVSLKHPSDLGKLQGDFTNYADIELNKNSCKFYQQNESIDENMEAITRIAEMFPKNNVHCLKVREIHFIWLQTIGSVKNIQNYVTLAKTQDDIVSEEYLVHSVNQMNIIVDSAGLGKTTVLYKIAGKLKQQNKSCWVLHYDLNTENFTKFLYEISSSQKEDNVHALEKLKRFITEHFTNKIEHNLFTYFLSKRKVTFCFDGFDEICSRYEDIFNLLLQDLKNGNMRVWLTSRKHMTESLQNNLSVFPIQLLPFSKENQIDFFVKYFDNSLQSLSDVQVSKEELQSFSTTLQEKISSVDKSIVETVGIPLYAKMFAKINSRELNKVNASPVIVDNILYLYEEFFKRSIERFLLDKLKQDENAATFKSDQFARKYMKFLKLKAFKYLIAEEYSILLTQNERFKLKELNNPDVTDDIIRIGIISSITKDNTKFLHLTFAEFFVAKFISDKLSTCKNKDLQMQKLQSLLDEVLYDSRWKVVRKFLNYTKLKTTKIKYFKYNPLLNVEENLNDTSLQIAIAESNNNIAEFTIDCLQGNEGNIKQWITKCYKDPYNSEFRFKPLSLAAYKENIKLVKLLLDHGADCNEECYDGTTALFWAAEKGHVEIAKLLLTKKADADHKDNSGDTALMSVARRENVEMAKLLLEKGADVNQKNNYGDTVLLYAAGRGNVEMAKLLLENRADADHKNNKGDTALMYAASRGNVEMVKLLLENRADVNHKNKNKDTALMSSARHDVEIAKLLLENKADVNHKNNNRDTALMSAARYGNVEMAKLLLENKADVNHKNNNRDTALMYAARYDVEMAKLLLENRADVNYKHNYGDTALLYAANGGIVELVKLLLENRADVNHKNNDGDTALMSSARHDVEMAKLLLENKADVNHKHNDGDTALVYAANGGNVEMVKLLLENKADINLKNKDGDTVLMYAAIRGYDEMLRLLLDRGADIYHKNKKEETALTSAASDGNFETVKLLLERGARAEDKDKYDSTLLMHSARNKDHDVVTYLLGTVKYNIRATDNNGRTALHWAARRGHCLNVKSLLDAGADIDCQDNKGDTPLHAACSARSNSLQCVQYLVQRGADRSIENKAGKTASDVCHDSEIKKWLQESDVNIKFVDEKNLTNGSWY